MARYTYQIFQVDLTTQHDPTAPAPTAALELVKPGERAWSQISIRSLSPNADLRLQFNGPTSDMVPMLPLDVYNDPVGANLTGLFALNLAQAGLPNAQILVIFTPE